MSIFEDKIVTSWLAHPHIEEFDDWVATADQGMLSHAIEELVSSRAMTVPETPAKSQMPQGLLALTPDLIAAAEAVAASKKDTSRGLVTEGDVIAVSNWIPVEQRRHERVNRKHEPHFKAWRPKIPHVPVLIPLIPVAPKSNACVGEDPRIFESQTVASIKLAKSICAGCTSLVECRDRVVASGDLALTQGGMSAAELRAYSQTTS